ncbi:hypothetical protein NHX12_017654 [Muraenolepis orangiensis]|uniref:Uncharacterized protein n=1 Tax=Muraenolepis orangiensis TaxID=630683 RepID=A0A9Q0EV10_9TELE|nr:hypothetical protein NHX12_017654 [Muraenolepis orangiensis]
MTERVSRRTSFQDELEAVVSTRRTKSDDLENDHVSKDGASITTMTTKKIVSFLKKTQSSSSSSPEEVGQPKALAGGWSVGDHPTLSDSFHSFHRENLSERGWTSEDNGESVVPPEPGTASSTAGRPTPRPRLRSRGGPIFPQTWREGPRGKTLGRGLPTGPDPRPVPSPLDGVPPPEDRSPPQQDLEAQLDQARHSNPNISDSRPSSGLTRGSGRPRSACLSSSNIVVEARYMGTLKLLDSCATLGPLDSGDSLRAVVYQDESDQRENALASFQAWKEKKSETLKAKAKDKEATIRKQRKAVEDSEEKKQMAKGTRKERDLRRQKEERRIQAILRDGPPPPPPPWSPPNKTVPFRR